jgi:hypothetical protein
MNDEHLENLSFDIDEMLMILGRQYGMDPFLLSSVVLARLSVMNLQLGNIEEWNKLLNRSMVIVQEEQKQVVVH